MAAVEAVEGTGTGTFVCTGKNVSGKSIRDVIGSTTGMLGTREVDDTVVDVRDW